MKARAWSYRGASILSVLFAAGHTFGFLSFQAPSEAGRRVWSQMNSVYFAVGSRSFSYGGFYLGFGLIISAAALFLAGLMWWLGNRVSEKSCRLRPITWSLIGLESIILAVSLRFFGAGPAFLSGLMVLALMPAAILKNEGEILIPDIQPSAHRSK
jgi:hypothetical protein